MPILSLPMVRCLTYASGARSGFADRTWSGSSRSTRSGVGPMRPDLRVPVRYSPRDDATPTVEVAALAACYRIIIESAKNRDHTPGAPRPQQKSGGAPDPTRSVRHDDEIR